MKQEVIFDPFKGVLRLQAYVPTFSGELSSAPSSPRIGDSYLNTGDNNYYIWSGTQWWAIAATPTGGATFRILLENGDNFMLENGDIARLE